MNINKNNYEVWFLDYFENQLSAEQVAELFLFLSQHPHLKEEFESFENTVLPAVLLEEENLLNKQSLKKYDTVCEENINEWLIAQVERELNAQQQQSLDQFLSEYPRYLSDQILIAKTKLAQDNEESFPLKSNLKQFTSVTTGNIQSRLIAELHGDLNLQERAMLWAFLENHPEFNDDKNIYQKTVLPSSLSVEFPNKQKLRKGVVIPLYQQKSFYRIAALILLILGAGIVFTIYQNNYSSDQHIAEIEDTLSTPIPVSGNQPSEKVKQYTAVDTLSIPIEPSIQKRTTKPAVPSTNYSEKENLAERTSPLQTKSESFPTIHMEETQEEIPALALKESPSLPVRETVLSVERRYTPKATIAYENPNEPPSLLEILKHSRIGNDVIDVTAQGINKVMGEELVSSQENLIRLPFKSRVLKFIANTIGKISNDKLKVRTSFNPITGKISAYEIQTHKKTIQRQFESANY